MLEVDYIVYLRILCFKLGLNYIGETKREIRLPMTEHSHDSRKNNDTPDLNSSTPHRKGEPCHVITNTN